MRKMTFVLMLFTVGCASTVEESRWADWSDAAETPRQETAQFPDAVDPDGLDPDASLEQVVSYGLRHSPSMQSSYLEWESGLLGIDAAGGLPRPKLSYGYYVEPVETRQGPMRHRAGITQTLPWFGRSGLRRESAASAASRSQAMYWAQALETRSKIERVWTELAFLAEAEDLLRSNLLHWENHEAVSRERYASGQDGYADLLRAQNEILALEMRRQSLADQREAAQAELNAVINLPNARLLDGPSTLPQWTSPDSAAVYINLASHPRVLAASFEADQSQWRARLASTSGAPDLSLKAEWIGVDRDDSLPQSGRDAWLVGAAITLPLFDRSGAAEKKAIAEREAKLTKTTSTLRGLQKDFHRSMFKVNDAERRQVLYRTSLIPRAEQSLTAVQSAYAAGKSSYEALSQANHTLLEFQFQYLRAAADRLLGVSELTALAGHQEEMQ